MGLAHPDPTTFTRRAGFRRCWFCCSPSSTSSTRRAGFSVLLPSRSDYVHEKSRVFRCCCFPVRLRSREEPGFGAVGSAVHPVRLSSTRRAGFSVLLFPGPTTFTRRAGFRCCWFCCSPSSTSSTRRAGFSVPLPSRSDYVHQKSRVSVPCGASVHSVRLRPREELRICTTVFRFRLRSRRAGYR